MPSKTPLAEALLARDPALDSLPTLWILHHTLAHSPASATTWHWFFCRSGLVRFSRVQFISGLTRFVEQQSPRAIASRTLQGDMQVLLGMYLADADESEARFYPSPFAELGLLHHDRHRKLYVRRFDPAVPPGVFLYALHRFRMEHFPDATVLDLELAARVPGSPFQTFGLSVARFAELHEELDGRLRRKFPLGRTAGMFTLTWGRASVEELLDAAYARAVVGSLL